MSVSTAISRITGFIRNWAMAYALGATLLTSSYVVANNIPNMIYELVAGGVLSAVFIPIFIERLRTEGTEDASLLASSILNVTVVVLGLVALAATIWAEAVVRTQTFTLSPAQAADAVYLFRFFAVQVVFYGVAAIFTGVLNSHRHFVAPAMGPIFNNLVVIVTLLGVYVPLRGNPEAAKTALAVGTTLGVVAQGVIMVPVLLRLRFRWRLTVDWHHPALRTLGRKMVPIAGYVLVNLIGVSFRNAFAFAAPTTKAGAGPGILQYAWMFYQLPYGVFAVALATAMFPELAEQATARDWESFRAQIGRGLRANAVLIAPAAAMLVGLAVPLCTLYRSGAFQTSDVPLVAGVLQVWALGLLSFTSYMFVMKGFYSVQDTRTPAITNVFATLLQVTLYATLTTGVAGWAGIGLRGIPAADAIAYTLHFAVLLYLLRRKVGGFDLRSVSSSATRILAASAAGGLLAWAVVRLTPALTTVRFGFLLQLLLAGAAGLAATYGLATLMRVRELEVARSMLARVAGRLLPWAAR